MKRVSKIQVKLDNGSIDANLTFNLNDLTLDEAQTVVDRVTDSLIDAFRTNVPFEGIVPLRNIILK